MVERGVREVLSLKDGKTCELGKKQVFFWEV